MSIRTYRTIVLACALAAPASAAAPSDGGGELVSEAQFAGSFADFAALPPAPEPAGAVVDLGTFDPPIEQAPAATPLGTGVASYYGRRFHGRLTASGTRFDMHAMTAAHKTLPFGTQVRVTNPGNGKSVVVTINDRGPFTPGRAIDLSRAAASEIGLIRRGHGRVELERLD